MGLAPFFVLLILVLFLLATNPSSLSPLSLSSIMDGAAVLLLLASAQCLIILMGRIDLSNSAFASFLVVLFATSLNQYGLKCIPFIVLFAALVGLIQASLHLIFQVPSFIITLAIMGIAGGASLLLSQATTIIVSDKVRFTKVLFSSPNGIPLAFITSCIIVGILGVVLVRTPWGRAVRAIGLNQRAVTFSGINTRFIITSVFMVSTTLISLAAMLTLGQLGAASSRIADSYLLPAIAAVVVGGTSIAGGIGGLGRTIWGVLIIALLRIALDIVNVPQNVQPVIYGIIIVVAIAITVDRARVAVVA
jgi:ribose transport system permease protein